MEFEAGDRCAQRGLGIVAPHCAGVFPLKAGVIPDGELFRARGPLGWDGAGTKKEARDVEVASDRVGCGVRWAFDCGADVHGASG